MGNALKILLMLFVIDVALYMVPCTDADGNAQTCFRAGLEGDTQNNFLGFIFNQASLNDSLGNPQINNQTNSLYSLTHQAAPQASVGSALGFLFTPIAFIFSLVSFFMPWVLVTATHMPFLFQVIIGGGWFLAEVVLVFSLLTGRDI